MRRGSNLQSIAIGGGLLALSVGAFALGNALSAAFKPLPAIVPAPAIQPMPVASSPVLTPPVTAQVVPSVAIAKPEASAAAAQAPAADPALPAPEGASPTVASSTTASANVASEERRAKARKDAAGHWNGKPGAVAVAPTVSAPAERAAASPAPETVPPIKAPEPSPAPANSATANPTAIRNLGFLTELKGVPEAIAAIDSRQDETASSLDHLVQGVVDNRSDPMSWSHLAAALDRGGQRAAAIAVANRAMNAAKRQQDGAAVTQLTQQIAQLEMAGSDAKLPAAPASGKVGSARKAEPATNQAPDKLAGALDEALRNNAATEALKILQQMAQGSIAKGDYAAAQQSYNHAITVAHLSKLGEARADQYANLGRMFLQKGDRTEAEAYWRAARDQYEQFDMTAKVAEMNTLLRQISPAALASPSRPTQSGKKTSSIIELR
jgi:tetratricopeptide (TPR) repeat protein